MGVELEKSVKCAIGEHLVLAELLKRGKEAYLAQGPTQKGWDILVVEATESKIYRVQVKTIEWPEKRRRTITVSKGMAFDVMVVVLLDLPNPHSRYLVLSKDEVENLASTDNPGRNAVSIYVAKELNPDSGIGQHENKWSKVGAPQLGVQADNLASSEA